jgi:hypothetical protein
LSDLLRRGYQRVARGLRAPAQGPLPGGSGDGPRDPVGQRTHDKGSEAARGDGPPLPLKRIVDFRLCLSAAIVTLRMVIRHATPLYRWDDRPTTRRLK